MEKIIVIRGKERKPNSTMLLSSLRGESWSWLAKKRADQLLLCFLLMAGGSPQHWRIVQMEAYSQITKRLLGPDILKNRLGKSSEH
jgi:hypothetical protein